MNVCGWMISAGLARGSLVLLRGSLVPLLAPMGSEVKAQKNKPQPVAATPTRKKLSYKEQRELEELETLLPQLEQEKASLEEQLSSGTLSHEALSAAAARIGELIEAIEEKEMRWLELSEI